MKNISLYKFFVSEDIKLIFSKDSNVVFIYYKKYGIILKMPNLYFFKICKNGVNFIFLKNYHFFSVIKQFFNLYSLVIKIYYFKLKLKGLGYRIKRVGKNLYRFFFAYKHYFYFHVP